MDQVPVNCILEMAKLESSITAVLAGFALTICVLLLQGVVARATTHKDHQPPVNEARSRYDIERIVLVFFISFYSGILASIMFASVVGDDPITNTDQVMFFIASLCFALCGTLIFFGLYLLTRWADLPRLSSHCKHLVFNSAIIGGLYMSSQYIDVTAILQHKSIGDYARNAPMVLVTAGIAVIAPLLAVLIRALRRHAFSVFSFCHLCAYSCLAATVVSVLSAQLMDSNSVNTAGPCIATATEYLFAFLTCAMILCTPRTADQ